MKALFVLVLTIFSCRFIRIVNFYFKINTFKKIKNININIHIIIIIIIL